MTAGTFAAGIRPVMPVFRPWLPMSEITNEPKLWADKPSALISNPRSTVIHLRIRNTGRLNGQGMRFSKYLLRAAFDSTPLRAIFALSRISSAIDDTVLACASSMITEVTPASPFIATGTIASMRLRPITLPRLMKQFISGTSNATARDTTAVTRWVIVSFMPALRFLSIYFLASVTSMSSEP